MLKKLLFIPFLSIFLFAGVVQAQPKDLPDPGMLPDNSFYFLKSWSEGIGTISTLDDVAKAERFLYLSERRLSEANALVAQGKTELAAEAVDRYHEQLNLALVKAEAAKAKGLNTDGIFTNISLATLNHQVVLADVYQKVPEQARPGIERAMQASMHGHEKATKAVSDNKREENIQKIKIKRQEVEKRYKGLKEKERGTPARPDTGRPATPGENNSKKPGVDGVDKEKPEMPEMKGKPPGSMDKPGKEKPQSPGKRY